MAALIEERLRITEEKYPQMRWGAWVIMPDHFHALIHMEKGPLRLGGVVGGFKAAVSREWRRAQASGAGQDGAGQAPRRTGEACLGPGACPGPRIWHRNFYERIVRDAEAEARITQ